jgi:hypothetical protein
VLLQNMMRIWRRTFVATLPVLLALVVLGYAVFVPDQRKGSLVGMDLGLRGSPSA